MTESAVASIAGSSVSRVEVDRDGPSVTADTLEALAASDRELFLVLGADAAANMPTWRRLEDTRHLATVVVVERDGEHADPPGPGLVLDPRPGAPPRDLVVGHPGTGSPRAVRSTGWCPPATLTYIREHDLYTSRR